MLTSTQTTYSWETVSLNEASFRSAGYALMIEDNPDQKDPSKNENVCTSRVWIKSCFPRTAKDVNLLERVFGNLHGIS